MTKYRVERKEVYNVIYLVDALDEKMAKELVNEGDGAEVDRYYWKDLSEYNVDTELMVYRDDEVI